MRSARARAFAHRAQHLTLCLCVVMSHVVVVFAFVFVLCSAACANGARTKSATPTSNRDCACDQRGVRRRDEATRRAAATKRPTRVHIEAICALNNIKFTRIKQHCAYIHTYIVYIHAYIQYSIYYMPARMHKHTHTHTYTCTCTCTTFTCTNTNCSQLRSSRRKQVRTIESLRQ